ncbi:hypothetical protein C8F04DRAFT_1280163 [Mycena alexandri]|uniref:Uncharacterized protein n=1 Tax=Mycena alexandri TaxID=1745969 RepID=A0AAD6WQD1_9AGAR|nr:hypothetical protein C8F04DRAFT_1280163 [Mycena alexandri]
MLAARCVKSAPPPPAIPSATNSSLIPTCAFLFCLPNALLYFNPHPIPIPLVFGCGARMCAHPRLPVAFPTPVRRRLFSRARSQGGALCVHIRTAAGSERGNPAFPFSDSRTPPPPVRAVCIECRMRAGRCVASPACVGRAGLVCVTSSPTPSSPLAPLNHLRSCRPRIPVPPESSAHSLAPAADAVPVHVRMRSIPAYVEGAEWMCGVGCKLSCGGGARTELPCAHSVLRACHPPVSDSLGARADAAAVCVECPRAELTSAARVTRAWERLRADSFLPAQFSAHTIIPLYCLTRVSYPYTPPCHMHFFE